MIIIMPVLLHVRRKIRGRQLARPGPVSSRLAAVLSVLPPKTMKITVKVKTEGQMSKSNRFQGSPWPITQYSSKVTSIVSDSVDLQFCAECLTHRLTGKHTDKHIDTTVNNNLLHHDITHWHGSPQYCTDDDKSR